MDLCPIATSCTRFKELIFQSFQRKHKILKLNFGPSVRRETAIQTRRLFQCFGAQIVELEIQFTPYLYRPNCHSAAIMDAVCRFCTGLKSLKLAAFDIPDNRNTFAGIGKLFGKLEKLHLENVCIEDIDSDTDTPNGNLIDFFGNCTSLIELKVHDSWFFYSIIFDSTFPNFEHFIFKDPSYCLNDKMERFILRHPNVKTFSVDGDYGYLPFLAENCKSLQKLGYRSDYHEQRLISSDILGKFHNLRELTCFSVGENLPWDIPKIVKVLPQLANSLELLDLTFGLATSDFIKIISKLKKLKVFRCDEIEIHKDHFGPKSTWLIDRTNRTGPQR